MYSFEQPSPQLLFSEFFNVLSVRVLKCMLLTN